MKKIYSIIISLSLMIAQTAFCQPTLTAANSNFVAGETFIYHSGTAFTPSPQFEISGANQTWDMSTFQATQVDSNIFVTPGSTPYAPFFPSATVAVDNGSGNYGYFFTSSSEISLLGTYSSSNSEIYTDSWKEMTYPFTFGNSFTDNFSDGVGTYGTTTATADGWGTMMLPYGNFTNLLRTHFHSLSIDTTLGTPDTIVEDLYVWFKAGTHGYLAEYYTIASGGFNIYGTRYLDQNSVGIENLTSIENVFSVYPNPTHDVIFFSLNENGTQSTKAELRNTLGQLVKEFLVPGNGTTNQLDVSDVPKGVYFLNVLTGQNKMCRKVIIG